MTPALEPAVDTYTIDRPAADIELTTDVFKKMDDPSSSTSNALSVLGPIQRGEVIRRLVDTVTSISDWRSQGETFRLAWDENATAVASRMLTTDAASAYFKIAQAAIDETNLVIQAAFNAAYIGEVAAAPFRQDGNLVDLYFLMLRYRAGLTEMLSSHGFEAGEYYTDQSGALILDYFRDVDRITLVFTSEFIQILAYQSGEFFDPEIVPQPHLSQLAVRDFLEKLLS